MGILSLKLLFVIAGEYLLIVDILFSRGLLRPFIIELNLLPIFIGTLAICGVFWVSFWDWSALSSCNFSKHENRREKLSSLYGESASTRLVFISLPNFRTSTLFLSQISLLEYELLSDFQSEFETKEDLRLLIFSRQGYLFLKILFVLFVYESFFF